jgi:hypothetical protein
MDIGKVLGVVVYILPFVIVALLIWDNFRLARRVAKLEVNDFISDQFVLGFADHLEELHDRVEDLEEAAKPAAPKTRAVKKPAAE